LVVCVEQLILGHAYDEYLVLAYKLVMAPGGLLQPLSIPAWKWDDISLDFIVGLPMTARKFDSIWVIVDRLSKSSHFIPDNTNFKVQRYAEIYIACVLCLHRVLKTIISDRGS
jgi:hypothetical protein